MTRIRRPLLFVATLAFAAGCVGSSDSDNSGGGDGAASRRPRGLTSGELSVLGLGARASEQSVLDALGRPESGTAATYDASMGDSVATWTYDGILVKIAGHEVVNIHCSATKCATADGVQVGDSRSKVIRTYGPPRSVETTDTEVLRYWGRVAECSLSFTVREESVTAIDLACDGS